MSCAHCLHRDAENLDMPKEVIDKVLDSVKSIGEVTFTDGEPSLNLDLIEYFFQKAERLNKLPDCFYIATNGAVNQDALALLLLKWYPKIEYQEGCGVALSLDPYHDAAHSNSDNNILKGLAFYCDNKEYDYEDERLLIPEGRAKSLRSAKFAFGYDFHDSVYMQDGEIEDLYVAANGNLVGGFNLSYEHIDWLAEYTVGDLPRLAELLAS